ncbi:Ankrd17, partial [Symbiodinium necroappetens]
MHQTLVGEAHGMLNAPGDGKFTDESDRTSLGPVIVQMVWNKLVYFLEQGDWHSYRCMLNEQRVRYLKSLDVDPIDGLIPKPPTNIDPFSSPQTFVLARFLHQNGFQSPLERDARGWSPLCFAAMNGDVMLVEALLDSKADVNDAITKAKKEMSLPKRMSVLSLAAFYHSSEVMRLLLARRAKLSATDAHQGTALHWASCSDNAEGVRILCAAGADPSKQCLPGLNPFNLACACSTANAMKELFAQVPSLDLRHSLHFAMMFFGGYSETVSFLIEVKADVNERFQVRLQEPVWWLIMNMAGIRHRLSPSRLTSLAYHHAGATPLMFSILSGYFEATSLLLAAGARLDTQNSRKKTAADFARAMRAPEPLLRSLQ